MRFIDKRDYLAAFIGYDYRFNKSANDNSPDGPLANTKDNRRQIEIGLTYLLPFFIEVEGLAIPAYAASLSYFDTIRSKEMPANLIQAQRDYFGAHTYELIGKEGVFHTNWISKNSTVSEKAIVS